MKKRQSAFTLLEIMLVISIIVILLGGRREQTREHDRRGEGRGGAR
jgi:prepilin-type N-terminal cleavage/methylation domain-containing protein